MKYARTLALLVVAIAGLSGRSRAQRIAHDAPRMVLSAPAVISTSVIGLATTADGKPAAGITLVPWIIGSGPADMVHSAPQLLVTDDQGYFRCPLRPEKLTELANLGDENLPLQFTALGAGNNWKIRLVTAGSRPEYALRRVIEDAGAPCIVHRQGAGPTLRLQVTVPAPGRIRTRLTGPDGQPIARRPVQLVAAALMGGWGKPGAYSGDEGAVVYEGRTDAGGGLTWQGFAGLKRLLVMVPDGGFGSTGVMELLAGHTLQAEIPSLMPFASAGGKVTPPLRQPGLKVSIDNSAFDASFDDFGWFRSEGNVGRDGSFNLHNLLPGRHTLQLRAVDSRLSSPSGAAARRAASTATATEINLAPGQALQGVVIASKVAKAPLLLGTTDSRHPRTARTADDSSLAADLAAASHSASPALDNVTGTLTLVNGDPVPGAQVHAVCTSRGQFDRGQEIFTTQTATDGTFHFAGLPQAQGNATWIVAALPQHPMAAVMLDNVSRHGWTAPPGNRYSANLVLPTGHPALTVQILQQGVQLAGAEVQLTQATAFQLRGIDRVETPGGGSLGTVAMPNAGAFDQGPKNRAALELILARLQPKATTDADGRAQFTDLTPGNWHVTANKYFEAGAQFNGTQLTESGYATATQRGVAVRSAETRLLKLTLAMPPANPEFEGRIPSGRVPDHNMVRIVPLDMYHSSYSWWSSRTTPGLWQAEGHFRDTPLDSWGGDMEPYYEGSVQVAISNALVHRGKIPLQAELREPATLRILLLDEKGHSRQGFVTMTCGFRGARFAASSSPAGEAVFTGVPPGPHQLTVQLRSPSRRSLPVLEGTDTPSDASLRGLYFYPHIALTVTANQRAEVKWQPVPVGYIRGKIQPLEPHTDYRFSSEGILGEGPAAWVNPISGEFVAGPFRPGKNSLRLEIAPQISPPVKMPLNNEEALPPLANNTAAGFGGPGINAEDDYAGKRNGLSLHTWVKDMAIDIPSGGILRRDIDGHNPLIFPFRLPLERQLSSASTGPIPPSSNFPSGTVYLADGLTPAWGALAAIIDSDNLSEPLFSCADARGHLAPATLWDRLSLPDLSTSPALVGQRPALLVVWLPGTAGAVTLPYRPDQEPTILLPSSATIFGRVTVGGQSILAMDSSFWVRAIYAGPLGTTKPPVMEVSDTLDLLSPFLSQDVYAQADGSFELPGLTPGNYLVQAARDGIWLSETHAVTVNAGSSQALELNIGQPGEPVLVPIVDSTGKPWRHHAVTLQRPPGPLADELWPRTLMTDAAGNLYLEGLEAREHQLLISPGQTMTILVSPARP